MIVSALLSIVAIGVSVWSIVESHATSQAQHREQQKEEAFAEAQTVQFIGGLTKGTHGRVEVDAAIENFNRLPLIYDEIRWPNRGAQYTSLGSCEQIYFSASTQYFSSRYIEHAVLFYRTPNGMNWERHLNGLPRQVAKLPNYQFMDTYPESLQNCHGE